MNLDLNRFKVEGNASPPSLRVVSGSTTPFTFKGNILAWDQSLADLGWAFVACSPDGLELMESGNIRTPSATNGHEGNLRRAVEIFQGSVEVIRRFKGLIHMIVHETPPKGQGAKMQRPESSLMAATSLRIAASIWCPLVPVVMVGRQRAAKLITGNGNAAKREVRMALKQLLPGMTIKNEAIGDAVAIAFVAAKENIRG